MLNPNGLLQRLTALAVRARTWAYSAYGSPVIQGSASGMAIIGTRSGFARDLVDQTTALSSKVLLVESSKS